MYVDSSSGYVIDSLVRNSYLKCRHSFIIHSIFIFILCYFSAVLSSLDHLDIVYKDPQSDAYSSRRSYHVDSDGESNYSDSELWLSKQQKRFSRKSKRLSQRYSQRSSTISCHRSTSEWTLSLGSDVGDNLPIQKTTFTPRLGLSRDKLCA